MVFQSPGDVAFHIAGMPVYYYGIVMAIAVFIGFYLAAKLYEKFYDKENAEKIIDMAPWLIAIGLCGARLYYCAVNYSYYIAHPLEIFNLRQGGLSIHGMMIAGIIALFFCLKRSKLNFFRTLDVMACATALAQAIGRWGNFFNSEAYGYPCDLPWKLYIPFEHRPEDFTRYEYFHPTFLYESILDLAIFIMLFIYLKKGKPAGYVFGVYIFSYSFIRIIVEYYRMDSALYLWGNSIAHWISMVLMVAAVVFIKKLKKT